MIHRLNYHDKWPTSDYELDNGNTGFVFLCCYPTWLDDKVEGGKQGVDITCRVIPWPLMCVFVVVGGGWLPPSCYNNWERVNITVV